MLSAPNRGPVKPLVLTAAYYASLALLGLSTAAEGPSLPTLAQHTSSPLNRISLLFAAESLGYLLGSLAGGRLYDRLPGHRLISAMLMLMLAASLVFPVASVLWLLLLLGFVLGVAKGAIDVGSNTLLQWVHGERVGPFMNGLHFCYGLGAFLAPLLLARIIQSTHEIYWVYWIISIVCVPLAVWLWFLPEPAPRTEDSSRPVGPVPFWPVFVMVLAFVLYVGAELGFSNWIYTYALNMNLADPITAAYLTSAYWASFTLGRLLGVWISTRVHSRTILYLDFAGCLVSLGLIALARDSAAVLWVGSIGLGLATASIFPTLIILAGEKLKVTGTITGLFLLGSGIGGMLLPWLIGSAFTATGPEAVINIILVDTVLGLGAVILFVYSSRATAKATSLAQPEP